MSGSRRRSPRFGLLLLLLLPLAACGLGTGTGESHTVWITAWADPPKNAPPTCFLDLTVVRDGAETVFADSVQAPFTLEFTASSGDLVYTDLKSAVPRIGTLYLQITVGGEIILNRHSIYSREALVISFWVP